MITIFFLNDSAVLEGVIGIFGDCRQTALRKNEVHILAFKVTI